MASFEPDISGTLDRRELLKADLVELYELHRSHLGDRTDELKPFTASPALGEFEQSESRGTEVLVDYGLAKWVGPQTMWVHHKRGTGKVPCLSRQLEDAEKAEGQLG